MLNAFLTKWCTGKVSGYILNTTDETLESHKDFLKSMQHLDKGDSGPEQNVIASHSVGTTLLPRVLVLSTFPQGLSNLAFTFDS